MLQITPVSRIIVAVKPVDFRKGIDSLSGLCLSKLLEDPMSGTIFLFRNRSQTSIRVLVYDGQGFWLCTKRLSKGKFSWWPNSNGKLTTEIDCREIQTLLWNGDPSEAQFSENWRKILP